MDECMDKELSSEECPADKQLVGPMESLSSLVEPALTQSQCNAGTHDSSCCCEINPRDKAGEGTDVSLCSRTSSPRSEVEFCRSREETVRHRSPAAVSRCLSGRRWGLWRDGSQKPKIICHQAAGIHLKARRGSEPI